MSNPDKNHTLALVHEFSESKPTDFWDEQIWTAQGLGLKTVPGSSQSKLYFHQFKQPWLLSIVKTFIFHRACYRQFSTVSGDLQFLRVFALFLAKFYPNLINVKQINEEIITSYCLHLRKKKHSPTYIKNLLTELKLFLDTGTRYNWFNIPCEFLSEWISVANKAVKSIPKFIPDDVLRKLNQHLEVLPEPVQRMVLVIQECGLRVSELVSLNFNCLQPDSTGGWFLTFTRSKIKKQDTIPISNELAGVIKAQQDYIRNAFNKKYKYLFCGSEKYFLKGRLDEFVPKPKIMFSERFNKYLNWLSKEFNLGDSSGENWHFRSHQFRHTVGTRMINNNVPHHIIQRYLGHSSPAMTSVYAHLMDSTLKKEINDYHNKVVNIAGEIIKAEFPELDSNTELQWMKKQILGEVLPNGYCALPANLTCSKGNACLQCGDFRSTLEFLDKHKEHRERTRQLLEVAKANNWQRQIQINEEILKSLNNIINELKKDHE